jgi:hypothetical protein
LLDAVHRNLGDTKSAVDEAWNVNYHTSGTFITLTYKTVYGEGEAAEQFVFRMQGDSAIHSTSKARSGRSSPLKTGAPKAANGAKAPVLRRKSPSAPTSPAQGPITTLKPGSKGSGCGARIRVRGRLQDMIRAEMFNLEKAASILRCLELSMDTRSVDRKRPYYPDVVEVAGDLIERSLPNLDVLYDGYIRNPLLAGRKIER